MTREEAARRYLEASRAAGASSSHRGREAHEGTMSVLEKRHPRVREHATFGAGEDFDRALGRNEREHQLHLQRESGLTNPQIKSRRRQLRDQDYGRHSAADVYRAANPEVLGGTRRERRGGRSGRRVHPVRRGARRPARSARSTIRVVSGETIGKTPIVTVGALFWEVLSASIGIAMLYLVISPHGSKVTTGVLGGLTQALSRLASADGLWATPAKKTATRAVSAPQVGVSKPSQLAASSQLFGSQQLPNYSSLVPTMP